MAKLTTTIHVTVGGVTTIYKPGVEVPDEHARLISTPGVWDGDAPVFDDTPQKPSGNSGADKWLVYANAVGIEVPKKSEDDRDAIKALVKAKEED